MGSPKDPEKRKLWQQRLCLANRGKKHNVSEQGRSRMSEGHFKSISEEHRKSIIRAHTGIPRTEDIKQRISDSHRARLDQFSDDVGGWQYREWVKSVLERDNFTCQGAGPHGKGRIHAHHIKDQNRFPELKYDISNGITLCTACHNREHREGGRQIGKADLKTISDLLGLAEHPSIEEIIVAIRKLKNGAC